MPDNKADKLARIFGSCIFLLLSAQIVFGCVWGILNFTSFQEFPESVEMITLSSGLALRNDTSVIYPALLLLVRTLTLNGPVAFYEVMYVRQLARAFVSWHTFAVKLLPFDNRFLRIWFALAVVTNPFAMQCHLAVLEFSFVSSFLCLLVTFTVRFSLEWKKMGGRFGEGTALRHICVASLFWLLVSLTRKEFFFIGFFCVAVLIANIFISDKKSGKHPKLLPVFAFLIFLGAIPFIDSVFRISDQVTAADAVKRGLYYRLAWTEDLSCEYTWPAHVRSAVGEEVLSDVMRDPGIVRTGFTEAAVKTFGRKGTSDNFLDWALYSFRDNKKGIILQTAIDMVGYVFPYAETECALSGRLLPGYVTGNYDVMRRNSPLFTKYYLRLSGVVYILMTVMSLVFFAFKKGMLRCVRNFLPALIIIALSSLVYTFYGANVWDHKKALFATCIWVGLFAALAMKGVSGKEEV